MPKRPEKAVAQIAVDSKYWLWINGQLAVFEGGVKRGPTPKDTYYDEVDLAPFLQKGKNKERHSNILNQILLTNPDFALVDRCSYLSVW